MTTPDQLFAYGVALVTSVAAGLERWRASKVSVKTNQEKEVVADAKAQEARGNLFAKMSEEYKGLLEKEYSAHQATRDYWHSKSNDFQTELSRCNERCVELQEKTDISKVEKLLLDQGCHLVIIAQGIQKLLTPTTHNEH